MTRTAAALVIGNEILSGKVQDTNTMTLANALRKRGVELRRVVMVPDEIDVIAQEVNALRLTHDYLFTSGGVGPTHDDVTMEAVARALGRRVVRDPAMASFIRGFYAEKCTDDHLRMADVAEGVRLVQGEQSPWPTFVLGNVFVLPGIPVLFRMKLSVIDQCIPQQAPVLVAVVYLRGDEGSLRTLIDAAVHAFPSVMVGSYPRVGESDHSLQVTFESVDGATAARAAETFAASLPAGAWVRTQVPSSVGTHE